MNENIGQPVTDANRRFDLNEDGAIDRNDRNILKKNYTKTAETIQWVNPMGTPNPMENAGIDDSTIDANALKSNLNDENNTNEININQTNKTTTTTNLTAVGVGLDQPATPTANTFINPMATAYTITSAYGMRIHPVTGEEKKHTGIDISGEWHTEIMSVADGEVVYAGENGAFGNCVEIKHIINGEEIYSFYAHLSEIHVTVGQTVSQGEVIGLEGGAEEDPGHGNSTGHHLHFEIRTASGYGNDVDPTEYIAF